MIDCYENRSQLLPEMVFNTKNNYVVKLERRVPDDGTKWYVSNWINGYWSYEDDTIEPSDLKNRIILPDECNI